MAFAWLVAKGAIPIAGATRATQMRDNLKALDMRRDAATIAELDAASAIDLGDPYATVG